MTAPRVVYPGICYGPARNFDKNPSVGQSWEQPPTTTLSPDPSHIIHTVLMDIMGGELREDQLDAIRTSGYVLQFQWPPQTHQYTNPTERKIITISRQPNGSPAYTEQPGYFDAKNEKIYQQDTQPTPIAEETRITTMLSRLVFQGVYRDNTDGQTRPRHVVLDGLAIRIADPKHIDRSLQFSAWSNAIEFWQDKLYFEEQLYGAVILTTPGDKRGIFLAGSGMCDARHRADMILQRIAPLHAEIIGAAMIEQLREKDVHIYNPDADESVYDQYAYVSRKLIPVVSLRTAEALIQAYPLLKHPASNTVAFSPAEDFLAELDIADKDKETLLLRWYERINNERTEKSRPQMHAESALEGLIGVFNKQAHTFSATILTNILSKLEQMVEPGIPYVDTKADFQRIATRLVALRKEGQLPPGLLESVYIRHRSGTITRAVAAEVKDTPTTSRLRAVASLVASAVRQLLTPSVPQATTSSSLAGPEDLR